MQTEVEMSFLVKNNEQARVILVLVKNKKKTMKFKDKEK